jgi:hypothetical protein
MTRSNKEAVPMRDELEAESFDPEVERIERLLQELEAVESVPESVPLAEDPEDALEGELPTRAIAIAEPMTEHDASIVALGDNVRQVTNLIESVGRTLEAQNQRTLRLMERLEAVAKALECMPEEADRNLEALDSVEEAIKGQRVPMDRIASRLDSMPDMVRSVQESNEMAREMWSVATRALAGRLAFTRHEDAMQASRESTRRRWRVAGTAALILAAFVGGAGIAAQIVPGVVPAHPVQADETERSWRVMEVRSLPLAPRTPQEERPSKPATTTPAGALGQDDVPSLGVDEEAYPR